MQVVERRQQPRVLRAQQSVAEHVTGHVTDPDRREVLLLDVAAQLSEMALDRLPRAAGGDPHLLVVISVRAAGGERVIEPEAVLVSDVVGDVGELRRPLVGGDDQVGIVVVVAHHTLGHDDAIALVVVGQVEQPAQELAIARDRLVDERFATALGRRALDDEPAL